MRKNREKIANGTYFVKSSMVPETAKLLSSEDTQQMFMGILEEAMIRYKITIKNLSFLYKKQN